MIRYDERSWAEKMHDMQGFIKGYSLTELKIYAKWLKYKQLEKIGKTYEDELSQPEIAELEKYIERNLIDFCEKHYGAFNYVLNYKEIDMAVASTRLQKLKLPEPLPITVREWELVELIDDENLRRILFTMLVDAKYFRFFNASLTSSYEVTPETVFYVQMDSSEIIKTAKVKFENPDDKKFCFFKLKQLGFIDATTGKNKAKYLKFVDIDSDSEVKGYVTDYEHIDLYYDLFSGGRIGICKHCGCLFKQSKTKLSDFCYKHRGYNKIIKPNYIKLICVDCGVEFNVSSKSRESCRCSDCQKKHRNEYMKNLMKNKRNSS